MMNMLHKICTTIIVRFCQQWDKTILFLIANVFIAEIDYDKRNELSVLLRAMIGNSLTVHFQKIGYPALV